MRSSKIRYLSAEQAHFRTDKRHMCFSAYICCSLFVLDTIPVSNIIFSTFILGGKKWCIFNLPNMLVQWWASSVYLPLVILSHPCLTIKLFSLETAEKQSLYFTMCCSNRRSRPSVRTSHHSAWQNTYLLMPLKYFSCIPGSQTNIHFKTPVLEDDKAIRSKVSPALILKKSLLSVQAREHQHL